jgi:hypothetical protein
MVSIRSKTWPVQDIFQEPPIIHGPVLLVIFPKAQHQSTPLLNCIKTSTLRFAAVLGEAVRRFFNPILYVPFVNWYLLTNVRNCNASYVFLLSKTSAISLMFYYSNWPTKVLISWALHCSQILNKKVSLQQSVKCGLTCTKCIILNSVDVFCAVLNLDTGIKLP